MEDEVKLLARLRNRERDSIDDAIRVYTPYLSTVLYNMVGNILSKEDIEEMKHYAKLLETVGAEPETPENAYKYLEYLIIL